MANVRILLDIEQGLVAKLRKEQDSIFGQNNNTISQPELGKTTFHNKFKGLKSIVQSSYSNATEPETFIADKS